MVQAALTTDRKIEAVVMGGSRGAVSALREILPGLPSDSPPVLAVVHVPPSPPSLLVEIFAPLCSMRVCEAEASEPIERGCVYFAPADYHLLVEEDRRCALSIGPPVHLSRPAIDVLFESAANVYGSALKGVILTGGSGDGARGLAAVAAAGGVAIVQDPATAEAVEMPRAALAAVPTAHVLTLPAVLAALLSRAS